MKMRIFCLAAAMAAVAVTATPARAFWVQANALVTPFQVTGQVYNAFPYPIFCGIRVQGLRNDGFPLWSFVTTPIAPGTSGFAVVATAYPFSFVNGQAFADCGTAPFRPFEETLEETPRD